MQAYNDRCRLTMMLVFRLRFTIRNRLSRDGSGNRQALRLEETESHILVCDNHSNYDKHS